jgi:uncharacterized protein YndB with AHSA1/START domain
MKKVLLFLALVVGLPLIVGTCFLGYAATIDEFTYTTSVQVNRSPAEVWSVFTDEEKMPEWLDGLESLELVSGEALQVGSVWKMHFDINGQGFVKSETVTAVEPGRLYAFDADNDYFTGHTEILFVEEGGATEIQTTNSMAAKSALFRAVFYLQRGMIAEQAASSYLKLAALCESRPEAS